MNFASDNTAGIAPEILQALAAGNDGFALGYGNDDVTRAVERRIGEVFEREAAVFLVPTGTAANALALAHVSPPWGAVFAHTEAHILTDECGAPEFFGGGLKLVGMPGVGCKVAPDTLAATVAQYEGHTPHQVVPAAFSFAQASEAGTIYRPDEIAALAKVARAHGMKVHMDGARFANALVRMNASPADITWKAGVDVLSFGATKGGALAAEAVVFFDRKLAANMAERRKRAGHLLSKHRFLALQMQAFLANDCWLRLARHANAMADRLGDGARGRRRAAGLAGRGQSGVRHRCRILWKRGLRPPARAIMCGGATACRRNGARARSKPDPAGDVVCHACRRDRRVRQGCRKGVTVPPQQCPNRQPMLGAGDEGGGKLREAANDLCRAGDPGACCAGRSLRAIRRRACCRPRKSSRPSARRVSIRSASRCGAGRITKCAPWTPPTARCRWSSALARATSSACCRSRPRRGSRRRADRWAL